MRKIAVLTSGGLLKGEIAATLLSEVAANKKELDSQLLELARVLTG